MKIIGHRGAKGLDLENTVASFQAGLNNHVDEIEFDIRTTSDKKLVVVHDPGIDNLVIGHTNYAELKKNRSDLLTMQEALSYIGNKCPVVVEIKKGSDIVLIISVLKNTKLPTSSRIASFDMPILLAIKAAFPETVLVVNEPWSGVRATYRARKLGTKYITMNQRWLWFGFIKSMARAGYKLSAYPLNDPIKAQRWAGQGLYAAVTDYPDIVKG